MELGGIFRLSCVITIALSLCEIGLASTGFCIDHGYTPKNGRRNPLANTGYKFFNGSVIRYSCYNNFELQPTVSMQICRLNTNTASTEWSPELPPKCVELPKCKTPTIPHANFDKAVYHEFDHLYVVCDDGYTSVVEESSICLETGQWSYLPTCKENYCPAPPLIEHGSFYPPMYDVSDVGERPPESTIFYTCDVGYRLDPANQQQRMCREGHWTGVDPKCILEGCDPPNLSYGDYIPKREHYKVGDTLTYLCRHVDDMLRTCLPDHTWSGAQCPESLTTEQMPPDTSSQHVYCTRPWSQNMHQTIKCCTEDTGTVVDSDTVKYTGSLNCCPERGLVEFVCDAGYTLKDEPSQWICSPTGQWVAMDSDSLDTMTDAPKCYSNTTRTGPNSLSDDMLKPVFGTAAGVLVLLSAAIIIAFCRPKLIDMKRRWREIREDEEELIIDGRRILLPSYEEAVTSQEPYLQRQQQPFPTTSTNCENDIAGPSHSRHHRETRTRNDSSSSVQSAREHPRPSCSSDEELLVPESSNPQTDSASSSRPQSLVLKAGTSVDSCVIINPPPNKTTISSVQQTETHSIPQLFDHATTRESPSDLSIRDDPMLEISEDTEVNLESIYPQAITASKTQIRPLVTDDGSNLLPYPLISGDQSCETRQEFTIHIDTDSIASNREEAVTRLEERDDTKSITATDKSEDISKDCHDDEDPQPVLPTSDHIHIVMSSQGTDRQQQFDEMGSTSV